MRPVLRMMVTLEFQRATGRCSQEGQEMVLEMQLARPRLCLKGRWRWAVRDAALAGMTLFFFSSPQKGLHPWQVFSSLDLIASAVLERGNLENLLHNILGKLNG